MTFMESTYSRLTPVLYAFQGLYQVNNDYFQSINVILFDRYIQ